MNNCIFCKLANGKIPTNKVYEDEDYMAILDIFPNVNGLTLVIPKKHIPSDIFDLKNDDYSKLMLASKKVVKILEKKFGNLRVALVVEGLEVDHAHIKLYPLHGTKKGQFAQTVNQEEVFFEKYPGYVTTLHGPKADDKELKKLATKLRG